MKTIFKYLLMLVVFLSLLIFFSNWIDLQTKSEKKLIHKEEKILFESRLFLEANRIKEFIVNKNNYNKEIAFLVDMKIESNKYRIFIYNLKEHKIIDKGLVAHGSGSEDKRKSNGELFFSNEKNSLCTSLGKYEIKNSYSGDFGKSYRLKGLDKTNSNAMIRNIVLHKYKDVPEKEQFDPICLSWGCPMVNENFYKKLEKIIDNSDKTILLSIYY